MPYSTLSRDGHVREQGVVLEDGVDLAVVGRDAGHVARRPARPVPESGSSKPAIIRSVVVLPEPEGPSMVKNSPGADLEVDRVDRDHVAVGLANARQADVRRRGAGRLRRPGPPPGRWWMRSSAPSGTGRPQARGQATPRRDFGRGQTRAPRLDGAISESRSAERRRGPGGDDRGDGDRRQRRAAAPEHDAGRADAEDPLVDLAARRPPGRRSSRPRPARRAGRGRAARSRRAPRGCRSRPPNSTGPDGPGRGRGHGQHGDRHPDLGHGTPSTCGRPPKALVGGGAVVGPEPDQRGAARRR